MERGSGPSVPEFLAPREILQVRGACRLLGARAVLDDVHLSLHEGEILVLLGPNGAGKTSLVRAISGRLALEAGSVRILGRDPREREARRAFGLVPQEIALYRELTARENLEVLGRLAGVRGGELRVAVEETLAVIGLAPRARDVVGTLSGGMQRRLNIGAALLHRPRLLLLDEPTVGVDPAAREAIHAMLVELRRRGLGVLLATHDLEQATELADRLAFLVEGRIRAEGTLDALVRDAFSGAKELRVVLASDPERSGEAFLAREGLAPVSGSRVFTGPLEGDLEDVSKLARRAEAAGLGLEEVRVREPGLRSVFFQLTGMELPR